MQFKHLIKTSVCALGLLSAVSARAADDVYVDLSVLNNLQPGDSLFVETQPLFPVVKKAPVKKAVKKKAKKKTVKKAAPMKVEVEETETGKSIVIAPQAPEIPQPLAEEKMQEAKPAEPITLPDAVSEAREEIAPINVPLPTDAEPGELQKVETQAVEEPIAPEAAAEQSKPAAAPVVAEPETEMSAPVVLTQEIEAAVSAEQKPAADMSAPVSSASEPEMVEPVVPAAEAEIIKPLIPTEAEVVAAVSSAGQIMFEDGDFSISPENAEKITTLVEGFENPQKHKIAIYAYNYDNGENSFKKKKLSLDRATEVRSLLLNKGYKNFSIKVINVTDDAEKRNLVEIEEIK